VIPCHFRWRPLIHIQSSSLHRWRPFRSAILQSEFLQCFRHIKLLVELNGLCASIPSNAHAQHKLAITQAGDVEPVLERRVNALKLASIATIEANLHIVNEEE
jgi:hypothetical protein